MESQLAQFQFLRPEWFWALIPAALLVILLWRRANNASSWQGAIAPDLLPFLLDKASTRQSRLPWVLLAVAWVFAIFALAGPTWTKLPQPIHKKEDALVIVLDLSVSMLATDVKPSRLVKARHKIIDILNDRHEGLTALVAYSGDAHGVIPLTDDASTITAIVPSLDPSIMPKYGSNTEDAMDKAIKMLKDGGATDGKILLVTDGVADDAVNPVINLIDNTDYVLHILGVGTEDGSPIATPDGNFMKDSSGAIVIPQLERHTLKDITATVGGKYIDMALTDSDYRYLLADNRVIEDETTRMLEREFDTWYEQGPFLILFILPFAAFAFRRGWLVSIGLLCILQPHDAMAFEWSDLWQRKDQQGADALQNGNPEKAANLFENTQWKGTAHYRSNNFDNAIDEFAKDTSASGHYNRGNALAKAGKLDEALKAYDDALSKNPDFEDAQFNRELVEQLKQQQEQQQQDGENSDQQDSENQNSENQDQQSRNSQDQQSQDQQSQDQQSQDQQSQSQSSQDQQSDNQQSENQQAQNSDQNSEEDQKQGQQQPEEDQQSEEEQQQAQQNQEQQEGESDQQQAQAQQANQQPTTEEQQAMEQWLRRIPEDPGGLLRRKFNYEYQQRLKEKQKNRFLGRDDDEMRW